MEAQEPVTGAYLQMRNRIGHAVARIVPPKEVEDIIQESYIRLAESTRLSNIEFPHSFILKTARNLALDYLKRAETRLTVSVDDVQGVALMNMATLEDRTFADVSGDEEFAMFCDAVEQLPTKCREAFVLKKVLGYSQREVASRLGIGESTVEKHVAKGLRRCMEYIRGQQNSCAANSAAFAEDNG